MFLIKKNPFDGKTYTFDTDEYDMFTDMFDESLHDNTLEPQIDNRMVCAYCQTCFLSRNKLFYHLGFMGIDVRKKDMVEDNPTRRRLRKYKRDFWNNWNYDYEERQEKRRRMDEVLEVLEGLKGIVVA